MVAVYFSVILQEASQFSLFYGGSPVAGTFALPRNRRLYHWHPDSAHDAVSVFNASIPHFTAARASDRRLSITPDSGYSLRLQAGADAGKLARLLGLYAAGNPADLTYYQTHSYGAGDSCAVNLQSAYLGQVGYIYDAHDLQGTPETVSVFAVSDAGEAAQLAGVERRVLNLSVRGIPGTFFSAMDEGALSDAFSATFWQAYNPRYSAPYVLVIDGNAAFEYVLRRPVAAADVKAARGDWHGIFSLELELQLIGAWEL